MADHQRTVDPADLQALFYKVMERNQVRVNEIKDYKRAVADIHGYGQYDCTECPHSRWESYYSWVTMDLKDMAITKRWRMKCRHCLNQYKPTFSLGETEKMIEKAICKYKNIPYNRNPDREYIPRRQFRPPHIPMLCEKCGWGQQGYIECWRAKPYSSFEKH